MKKILSFICCLCSIGLMGASAQVIEVSTKDLSLVLTVDEAGQVLFQHFGPRIADPAVFLQKETYRREDHCTTIWLTGRPAVGISALRPCASPMPTAI